MVDTLNPPDPARSGFWRRALAFIADMAIVLVPLEIVVAILFAQTNGMIQGDFGFTQASCEQLSTLPVGLVTQIENPNYAADCRKSLFGFDTARLLVVSRIEKGDVVTTSVSESFWLDADGNLADRRGYDVSWIALAALLAYLVAMEGWRGATLGKKATGIRTIFRTEPLRQGVGVGRALARRLAMMLGGLGMLPFGIVMLWYRSDAAALAVMSHSTVYWVAAFAGIALVFAWVAWIVVAMIRKRDTVYDRIAGTAVVRARS